MDCDGMGQGQQTNYRGDIPDLPVLTEKNCCQSAVGLLSCKNEFHVYISAIQLKQTD